MTRRALVLLGHGSSRNPNTRAPICACAERLRATGVYDQVVCGLLKQAPSFDTLLGRVDAGEVTLVPFFMSEGYYTHEVIPRLLGLTGRVTQQGDRTLRLAPVLGLHPGWTDILQERAGKEQNQSVVVLGHGTPRNPRSSYSVFLQAERLRRTGTYAEVVTLFIDQDPNLRTVFEATHCPSIRVVPFFAGDGWHVTETIPEDLGLREGRLERGGRMLHYTGAVGTHPAVPELVLASARSVE